MKPVSGSLAAFLKFYGMVVVTTLAIALVATVVIMMRLPRSPQEWAVGLICTVVSSLTGGRMYACITAGISGATEPTGETNYVTNGTAIFAFKEKAFTVKEITYV